MTGVQTCALPIYARIEYRGRGATDDTQGVGWFTRLLLKLAPF